MEYKRDQLFLLGLCLAVLNVLFPTNTYAADADYSYTSSRIFEIVEEAGVYTVEEEVAFQVDILSDDATKNTEYSVRESFYTKIEDIRAWHNKSRINSENISYRYVDAEDVFINDTKLHIIDFGSEVKKGDKLRYKYEAQYDDIAYFPIFYIGNNGNIAEYRVDIEHPDNVKVEFEIFFTRDSIPYELIRDDDDLTTLIFRNIDETDGLDFFNFDGYHAAVLTKFTKNGQPINKTSPQDFAQWYFSIFNHQSVLAESCETFLGPALGKARSDMEKVKTIYDYVRGNVRYIADESGVNAIVPRHPDTVLNRKYGDCKDKAFLIAAIARQLNLDVKPVLLSTRRMPEFNGATHVFLYNHVINVFEDNGKRWFFDPTFRDGHFGSLPQGDILAQGLILDAKASESCIIDNIHEGASIDVQIDAKMNAPDAARATIRFTNDIAGNIRYAHKEYTQSDFEEYVSGLLAEFLRKIKIESPVVESQDENSLTISAKADISKFLITTSKRTYVPLMPFNFLSADVFNREQDKFCLHFSQERRFKCVLSLDVPFNSVEGQSQTFREKNFWHDAHIEKNKNGNCDFVFLNFRVNKVLEREEKDAYIAACRELFAMKKQMYTIANH